MKKSNLMRMVMLILLLSSLLMTSVGCNKQPSENEQAMALKWENVVRNADADVVSVDIAMHTVIPTFSAVLSGAKKYNLDEEAKIEELLNIVRDLRISFEELDTVENVFLDNPSYIGKKEIAIDLKDSAGANTITLRLYENGDIFVWETLETIETGRTYLRIYQVHFEDSNTDVFEAFADFYKNKVDDGVIRE